MGKKTQKLGNGKYSGVETDFVCEDTSMFSSLSEAARMDTSAIEALGLKS